MRTNIRKSILYMTHYSKSSHVGACLSIVDILFVLYFKVLNIDPLNPNDKNRDKFILSKGHGGAALYATLAERGFFPKEYLSRYYIDDGILPGHLDMEAVPGVEASAGSLGHGLSIGVGMALANRSNKSNGEIYVLLGDGECNEGSVWEAIMLAAQLKLNNLTVIIDFNRLQGLGTTNQILNQDNLVKRFTAFDWEVYDIDGHDLVVIEETLKLTQGNKPRAIIARTVKGKGVSYMENQLEWHYKSPNKEQYDQAIKELEGQI